jgi:hypothetical protein
MNRSRLANGSEIETAKAGRATRRPLHCPRAPLPQLRRNALHPLYACWAFKSMVFTYIGGARGWEASPETRK